MYQDELTKLSKEELMARVLAQTAQIEELTRRPCQDNRMAAERGGE